MTDIITDLLTHIVDLVGQDRLPIDALQEIEERVRKDWAGSQPYISRRCRSYIECRDDRILRDWRRGESIQLLSRRYRLTDRRIRQIINNKRKRSN